MIVYAAIDLKNGEAVQLVGGRADAQRIAWPEPVAVAQRWIDAGFRALHVVDLDAALGSGDNRVVIAEILDVATVPVQVGGGVRDDESVAALVEAGASRIIAGTRAVEDPAWRARMAQRYQASMVVAADVRGDHVVTRGWTTQTKLTAATLLDDLNDEPLAGVLITDVGREGQMTGIDVAKFAELVKRSRHPIMAAGGIRDLTDLRVLAEAGVAGAVLGMSLYTGAIDPAMVAAEFA
jgi:phosphoribosylformimino-5-aminoimidazole carboxamide ribotide isomerase